jgi:hypothetical protein
MKSVGKESGSAAQCSPTWDSLTVGKTVFGPSQWPIKREDLLVRPGRAARRRSLLSGMRLCRRRGARGPFRRGPVRWPGEAIGEHGAIVADGRVQLLLSEVADVLQIGTLCLSE